jgi:hypothetical protein
VAPEDGDEVDGALIVLRDDIEAIHHRLDLRTGRLLQGHHDDVLPARLPPPSFFEHAQRFADARRISEKYLQPSTRVAALARFDTAQQLARIRPAVITLRHAA